MTSEKEEDEYLSKVLETLKQNFEAGNKESLLRALFQCLLMKRPPPEWLRAAFVDVYETATGYGNRSWDEVFGKPTPKGTNLKKERRNMKLRFPLSLLKSPQG
jgi:hypothetical protein